MTESAPSAHHVEMCLPDSAGWGSRHWGWQCFTCGAEAADVGTLADAETAAYAHDELRAVSS